MFYCQLKKMNCPHLHKGSRTISPRHPRKRRGECLICSKLPGTKNIVKILTVYDGGPADCSYHNATSCPLDNQN